MNTLLLALIPVLTWLVGKSCFGIYVLLRRISESQDVIYALAELTPVHFHANVASYSESAKAFLAIWEKWGRIDAVLLNAGIVDRSSMYILK